MDLERQTRPSRFPQGWRQGLLPLLVLSVAAPCLAERDGLRPLPGVRVPDAISTVAEIRRIPPTQPTSDHAFELPLGNRHEQPTAVPAPVPSPSPLAMPWWQAAVQRPLRPEDQPTAITLEQLLTDSLVHSPYVNVIKELPLIRETSIKEADAQFDWVSFVESLWADISEPVGSRLTTGGPDRLRDDNVTTSAGLRRKNVAGGQFEIAQRIGHQDTNSIFFVPANQGTTRLTLNYTQPLLRTAGKAYNTALTVLATIDTDTAGAEFSQQLQAHLVDVTRAYWDLYRERANLLQRRRLLRQAQDILTELEQRAAIDALQSQILRARAAVQTRRADIGRAETEVRNAESRIRTLVNAPSLGTSTTHELIPQDHPSQQLLSLDVPTSLEIAMQSRPEIVTAVQQIRAAGVRLNVAKNEMLPALNLILETYVSGLRGGSNVGGAWLDQWRNGEPSYSIGLQYEFPLWNRSAQARHDKRRLELRQAESQLKATIENLRLEIEVAVREVSTTHGEMRANFGAMQAVDADLNYLYDRWQHLPGTERTAALFLEDLLDAQERLNAAEFAFLDSQNKFNVSQVAYQKSVGTLLERERITLQRYCECHLPGVSLRRVTAGRYPMPSNEVAPAGALPAP